MSEFSKELEKETATLKRIINGYISTNPILAALELRSLSFQKRQAPDDKGLLSGSDSMKNIEHLRSKPFAWKECKDEFGNTYDCYEND